MGLDLRLGNNDSGGKQRSATGQNMAELRQGCLLKLLSYAGPWGWLRLAQLFRALPLPVYKHTAARRKEQQQLFDLQHCCPTGIGGKRTSNAAQCEAGGVVENKSELVERRWGVYRGGQGFLNCKQLLKVLFLHNSYMSCLPRKRQYSDTAMLKRWTEVSLQNFLLGVGKASLCN